MNKKDIAEMLAGFGYNPWRAYLTKDFKRGVPIDVLAESYDLSLCAVICLLDPLVLPNTDNGYWK